MDVELVRGFPLARTFLEVSVVPREKQSQRVMEARLLEKPWDGVQSSLSGHSDPLTAEVKWGLSEQTLGHCCCCCDLSMWIRGSFLN